MKNSKFLELFENICEKSNNVNEFKIKSEEQYIKTLISLFVTIDYDPYQWAKHYEKQLTTIKNMIEDAVGDIADELIDKIKNEGEVDLSLIKNKD